KGDVAGEHLVENDAETVEVADRPQPLALAGRLLRGHVVGGPENVAGSGMLALPVQMSGQAEVGDFGDELGERGTRGDPGDGAAGGVALGGRERPPARQEDVPRFE